MINKLPKNWKVYKLGDVFTFQKKSKRKAGDGMEEGRYSFFTSSQNKIKYFNKADYNQESIILGTGGLPSVHFSKNFSTSTDVFILCPNRKDIYCKYVYYFLRSRIDILQNGFKGAGLKHISKVYINNIPLPFPVDDKGTPDLKEQKRIVAILEEAEGLKKKREEANNKMEELIPALYDSNFGKYNNIELRSIEDIIANQKGSLKTGPFGSSLKKEIYTKSGYRIYGQEQVIAGTLEIGDYFIDENKYNEMKSYAIQSGDILISLVGTYGKILIVPDKFHPGIINPRLLKITLDRNKVRPYFFVHLLRSKFITNQLERLQHGQVMGVLNLRLMRSLNFYIPSIPKQDLFIKKAKEIERLIQNQQKISIKFSNLFNSLMQKAFSGKL